MAIAKMTVYQWREIMRVCGSVMSNYESDNPALRYIDMCFHDEFGGYHVAYGSNGCQISRVIFQCDTDDIPWGYHLLIPAMKTPARTRSVEIHLDDDAKEYNIVFLDEDNDIISAVRSQFADANPLDYKSFFKKAHENFDQYNHGEGKYCIAVNPKYLLSALEGFKSCDNVILNFGSHVHPFTIRPGDDSMNAEALILPVRKQW